MRIFDVHVHYSGDIAEAPRFVDLWRAGGIEKTVVFAMNIDDGSHATPAEVETLAKKFPDFFIPFGFINLGYEDGVAAAREAAARGFRGVKFIYPSQPYDVDEFFPVYEEIAKAGMACLFHTGIVIGTAAKGSMHGLAFHRRWRVSSNFMRPGHLDRIARTFPEMTVIGAHVGGAAWYEEATQVANWSENIYFDMSIGQFHYVRRDAKPGEDGRAIKPRIRTLYETGQLKLKNILFGTDAVVGNPQANPAWSLRTLQFELDALGATEEEKEAVRWGTAARLLGVSG